MSEVMDKDSYDWDKFGSIPAKIKKGTVVDGLILVDDANVLIAGGSKLGDGVRVPWLDGTLDGGHCLKNPLLKFLGVNKFTTRAKIEVKSPEFVFILHHSIDICIDGGIKLDVFIGNKWSKMFLDAPLELNLKGPNPDYHF
jgi:hypothetical protein